MTLTNSQRAELRSIGSKLDPIVYVGKEGITDSVIGALDEALSSHELVKVKFIHKKDQVKELSDELENKTGSLIVATTGFTTLFFRQNPNVEDQIYRI